MADPVRLATLTPSEQRQKGVIEILEGALERARRGGSTP